MVSGYGVQMPFTQSVLDALNWKDPLDKLENWDHSNVRTFVDKFVEKRFPTILALNKIDMKDSAKNINTICSKYGEDNVVLVSGLSECFLQHCKKKGFIYYEEGSDDFKMHGEPDTDGLGLKPIPENTKEKLQKIRDMVLFRYGSTGCVEAIQTVIKKTNFFPVYLVGNMNKFTASDGTPGVFRDGMLVPAGSTVSHIARAFGFRDRPVLYAYIFRNFSDDSNKEDEVTIDHQTVVLRVGAEHVITPECNIIKLVFNINDAN
eukprot:TRINITY_DN5627_c0_g1_i2.p1 TRINITY_DN5627_c0_g1~~TRINITY_DN5627_c0_g1_i2.p1  ORF type:complete len:262 (-),score=46.23 TRINITY_DN5627_c0_g1_i2:44-829(-)